VNFIPVGDPDLGAIAVHLHSIASSLLWIRICVIALTLKVVLGSVHVKGRLW
jgi:hypothetical protein